MKLRFQLVFLLVFATTLSTYSQNLSYEDISHVLQQLKIAPSDCYDDLVVNKVIPYSPSQSVVIIPKLNEKSEDGFSADWYILIIDNASKKIVQQYYEADALTSDAIRIQGISIDFAPFQLNKTTRAFGIRILYEGDSRPNPYEREDFSLFVIKGKSLVNVLSHYTTSLIHGEWDTTCDGEFESEKKILIMSDKATNGYFDIIVKNKITTTTNTLVNDVCDAVDVVKDETSNLKFNGTAYK